MIDFAPPPKLWLPPKPAIIRAASLEEVEGVARKATFPFPIIGGLASWKLSWSQALNANTGSWAGFNIRQVIPASGLSFSGSNVRITCQAATDSGITVDDCHFGEKKASSDPFDFVSVPTRITFNAGNNGFTLSSSGSIVSDAIAFALDETKDYLVAFYVSSGNTLVVDSTGNNYYKITASETGTADVTGYSSQTRVQIINKLEVS